MSDFSKRLKDLRAQKGLTQEEVAAELYVTKQAVSKWENDNSLPDVASLDNLAKLYGVSIDYLLTGEENVKVEIVEKEKLVEVEKPLPPEMVHILLMQHQRAFYSVFGTIFLGIVMLGAGIGLMPMCIKVIQIIFVPIIFMLGGLFGILGGIYNIKKYKKQKAEIEEKTGRKLGIYNYRCDKEKAEFEKIERNHKD